MFVGLLSELAGIVTETDGDPGPGAGLAGVGSRDVNNQIIIIYKYLTAVPLSKLTRLIKSGAGKKSVLMWTMAVFTTDCSTRSLEGFLS